MSSGLGGDAWQQAVRGHDARDLQGLRKGDIPPPPPPGRGQAELIPHEPAVHEAVVPQPAHDDSLRVIGREQIAPAQVVENVIPEAPKKPEIAERPKPIEVQEVPRDPNAPGNHPPQIAYNSKCPRIALLGRFESGLELFNCYFDNAL